MKYNIKRISAAVIACLICLSAFAFNAFAEGSTHNVSTEAELTDALNAIGTNGTGTIVLNSDLSNVGSIGIGGSQNITILGNGHTVSFAGSDACLNVSGSATLNLGEPSNTSVNDLTLTKAASNDGPGVLSISGNAKVNMYDGVTIKDAQNNNYYGGGVTIGGQSSASNKAVFHMYGGTIDNCGVQNGGVCYGGGVAVCNGGTFIMDGGTISNCYATTIYYVNPTSDNATGCGGGVFVGGGSSFVMNGGTIENCTASSNGGGVAIYASYQSGLGNMDSEFTMNGGTITGCSATGCMGGGVFATGRYVNSAAICAPTGSAGTVANKGIHILGGTISNNSAYELGGGIGLFELSRNGLAVEIKNTTITGNSAPEGGGIGSLLYWTRFNVDNCIITGNTAVAGGGIAIDGYNGSNTGNKPIATVTNSTIGNNLATAYASDVYVYDAEMHLCDAGGSGIVYTNAQPIDLTNRVIEKWYEDNDGDRFVDQAPVSRVAQTQLDLTFSNRNEYMLIAAPTFSTTVSGSFVLTKDFVAKEGYDGAGYVISNIESKVTVDPEFVITKYNSFNRIVGMDPVNDIPAFSETSYTIPVSSGEDSITIELPDYTTAGIGDYWYEVTESSLSGTAGVTDDTVNPRYLHVQVIWGNAEQTWMTIGSVSLHKTAPGTDGSYINETDDKSSGFTNTFGAGTLTVTKNVAGNMADPNKLFKVTVALSAPEGKSVKSTISYSGGFTDEDGLTALNGTIDASGWTGTQSVEVWLKDGASITFTNIPDGVSYTVEEAEITGDSYVTEYEIQHGETDDTVLSNSVSGKISDQLDEIIITNRKEVPLDVGVILENTPFVILLSGGVAALVAVPIVNRKKKDDDEF